MKQADLRMLIKTAATAVQKQYPSSLTMIAAKDLVPVSEWASTGSVALDRAISAKCPGGIPIGPKRGRVVHLYGDPSTGKSLILDVLFASCQAQGGVCIVSETEGSRDPHFAAAVGLNLDDLVIQRPDTIELLFDSGMAYILKLRDGGFDGPVLWGLDSLETVEAGRTFGIKMSGKEGGNFQFGGGRAAAISAGCRKIAAMCNRTQTSFVILNQMKDNVGVMFGATKKPTGGNSPKFMASVEVRLSSSKFGKIERNGRIYARWVHARVEKNKVAAPFAQCDFLIDFDKGVNKWAGLMEALETESLVRRDKDGTNFVDLKTGEVVPLLDFIGWASATGRLE